MNQQLIVVANAAHARLFTRETDRDPLVPLPELAHPASRQASGALAADHAGHQRSDDRPGGVSFAAHTDPHRKEHLAFAQELADRIEQAVAHDGARQLVVLASSPFLGELKARLGHASRAALRAAIDRDLTHVGLTELEQRVAHELQPARS